MYFCDLSAIQYCAPKLLRVGRIIKVDEVNLSILLGTHQLDQNGHVRQLWMRADSAQVPLVAAVLIGATLAFADRRDPCVGGEQQHALQMVKSAGVLHAF